MHAHAYTHMHTQTHGAHKCWNIESTEGKRVLRRAMTQLLPEEFTAQRKQGFSPPDANWYRGPSMDYIKQVLFDRKTLERPWFDQKQVAQSLEEHFTGQRNHRLLIWSLLSIEWIQRHFVDHHKSGTPSAPEASTNAR